MANRCTLHLSHMEAFKQWLAENSYAFRDGKGDFQVLQVMTDNDGWQSIYSRLDMPEHYTVQDKLMYLVKRFFLANRKSADEITRLRQQVAMLTEQRDALESIIKQTRGHMRLWRLFSCEGGDCYDPECAEKNLDRVADLLTIQSSEVKK